MVSHNIVASVEQMLFNGGHSLWSLVNIQQGFCLVLQCSDGRCINKQNIHCI